MTAETPELSGETSSSLRTWLFNPFHYLAGGAALVFGQLADGGEQLAERAGLAGEPAFGLAELVGGGGLGDEPVGLGLGLLDVACKLVGHVPFRKSVQIGTVR